MNLASNAILLTALLLVGCQDSAAFGKTKLTSVYAVTEVTLAWSKKNPKQLIIKATGMVNSGGWGAASLENRKSEKSEVMKFDMLAEPPKPGSIVTQAFEEVKAKYTLMHVPADVQTIQVQGGGNVIAKKLPPRP